MPLTGLNTKAPFMGAFLLPKHFTCYTINMTDTMSNNHLFPKIIWQTHNYKQNSLPEHISQIAGTWKNLNPQWDYKYIDHEQRDAMVSEYPEIHKIYKKQAPGFQSDIWRILVTYQYGGCYADMDSVCVKPLDYLLQDIDLSTQMVVVPVKNGYGNTHNYITKADSDPLRKVVETMKKYPDSLVGWETWKIFVNIVYSYNCISPNFIVQTEHNSIEDLATFHDKIYKKEFNVSNHKVNNYGTIIDYLDFIKLNNLPLSI